VVPEATRSSLHVCFTRNQILYSSSDVLVQLDSKPRGLLTPILSPQGLSGNSNLRLFYHSFHSSLPSCRPHRSSKQGGKDISTRKFRRAKKCKTVMSKPTSRHNIIGIEEARSRCRANFKGKRPAIKGVTPNDVTDLTRKTGRCCCVQILF